jgi:YD repeat-containing protein
MTEHIEQAHWGTFFNDFAKKHHGFDARIEIIGRDFGDQDMAAWLPFSGISYDPHHQQLFVTVGGISSYYPAHLTHTIDSPRTVAVRYTPAGEISSILITAGDKTETLVTLRRQPALAK